MLNGQLLGFIAGSTSNLLITNQQGASTATWSTTGTRASGVVQVKRFATSPKSKSSSEKDRLVLSASANHQLWCWFFQKLRDVFLRKLEVPDETLKLRCSTLKLRYRCWVAASWKPDQVVQLRDIATTEPVVHRKKIMFGTLKQRIRGMAAS